VPVDRRHAFAGGPVYGPPNPLSGLLRPDVARAWRSFRRGAVVGEGCRLGPSAWCANEGPRERVALGARVVCRGIVRREVFGDGTVAIEDDVYIGDDCIVSCAEHVRIGAGTLLGHGVQIFDNNSHPLERTARESDWTAIRGAGARAGIESAAVTIGAGAWIGFGALVLKGVAIGEGAIVGAGSVVTGDVAPAAVVVGNPARPLGRD
jgi:acetyltransferase-like isoleucine patch superfamily enzyme